MARTCGLCHHTVIGCEHCGWSIEPSILVYCVEARHAHFHPTCAPQKVAKPEPWSEATMRHVPRHEAEEELASAHKVPELGPEVSLAPTPHCGVTWSSACDRWSITNRRTRSGRCGECDAVLIPVDGHTQVSPFRPRKPLT